MAPFYNNPGQVNDEAINIAGGKTFQVMQLADSEGNVIDPLSEQDITVEVELSVPVRVPTTSSVSSSSTSVLILAANNDRKGISVSNISTSKLYLSFTNPATVANCFIELSAGAFFLFDQQMVVGNAIYGIWASANGAAQVTEYA